MHLWRTQKPFLPQPTLCRGDTTAPSLNLACFRSSARLLTQTESAREFSAIFRGLLEMLLRFRTRVSLKRVACGAKIARFLAKNASFSRTRLSDGAVNSKWPNFETES